MSAANQSQITPTPESSRLNPVALPESIPAIRSSSNSVTAYTTLSVPVLAPEIELALGRLPEEHYRMLREDHTSSPDASGSTTAVEEAEVRASDYDHSGPWD